ncbi:MAG: hypothetical protein MJ071_05090 [Oscillospiraceae bacterium]|nr:hypothetical protein [Oscillospiraceae bacterium]
MENTSAPNGELLKQLNRFTRREHSAEEVYLFDMILCDNETDRDGDCFSDEALAELQKRFVGVTGIFDHNPKSACQTARIFQTELIRDESRRTQNGNAYCALKAHAYMVRTDSNADLIREIDAGIKKEVSISCAVSEKICSVCGANVIHTPCAHIKGRKYAGKQCYTTLCGVTDVYEWSFVAVPAQPAAGVVKTFGGSGFDAEKEALRSAACHTEELLSQLTEELRREVIRLCYRNGENACADALADTVIHMDASGLMHLKETLSAAESDINAPQLSAAAYHDTEASLTAFRTAERKEA